MRKILKQWPLLYAIIRNGHILVSNVLYFPKRLLKSVNFKKELKEHVTIGSKVWYFCVPVHNNLGDYAQYCCIKEWISNNFPERSLVEIPTMPIRYDYSGLFKILKRLIKPEDIIVFQSGYTSSNLHPDEGVHRKIVKEFKNKTIFFPQTVKYTSEKEVKKTANIYNNHGNITFLARDKISYETASKYFYGTNVMLVPDIVTTKIGKKKYSGTRLGISFCIRHDSEKKYSDDSIKTIFADLTTSNDIWTDTTLNSEEKCSEELVENKIRQFATHKLTITDRFHGTIFSLAASTPVIVLRTTDHKVTEGAEWFTSVIPEYIRIANSLEEAHEMAKFMLVHSVDDITNPYYENTFYANLKSKIFDQGEYK